MWRTASADGIRTSAKSVAEGNICCTGRSESAIRMQRIAAIIAFLLMRIAITLNPRTALPHKGAGD